MHEDDIYVVVLDSVLILLLALLLFLKQKKFAIFSFVIFITYTSVFLFKYFYKCEGGGAFVAWGFMLFLGSLQLLVTIIYAAVILAKNKIRKQKLEA
jgi:hypothetical protein